MKFCTNCGGKLSPEQKFCVNCGKPIKNDTLPIAEPTYVNTEPTMNKGAEAPKPDKPVEVTKFTEQGNSTQTPNLTRKTKLNKTPSFDEKPKSMEVSKFNEAARFVETPRVNEAFNSPQAPRAIKKPKTAIIISLCLLLALSVALGFFAKPITSKYYLFKYDSEKNIDKKLDYAYKAFSKVNNNKTKEAFESTIKKYVEEDALNAESKLAEYKESLPGESFNQLSIALYNAKAEKLISENQPKEAFNQLVKVSSLKGTFKDNKSYEKIMLGIVSTKLNISGYDSQALLAKEKNIYIKNMDDDSFDEIIELKEQNMGMYSTELTVNLYKYKNGEYVKLDSTTIDYLENIIDAGIYPYEKDKYGIFISGSMAKYNKVTYVFGIYNDSIMDLGSTGGFNMCSAVDIDKDGIYEVEAHVIDDSVDTYNYSYADMPLVRNVYKVSSQNRNLVLIKSEKIQATTSTFNNSAFNSSSGYIFVDSNSRYLADDELSSLTLEQLELARNEIFARYGYIFNLDKFKTYFSGKSWYIPNPSYKGEEGTLNDFEKANYKIIQKWETLKK